MHVIHYHNEHAYGNPGECEIYGPYPDLDAAKAGLVKLAEAMDDPLFKIDSEGTYAGFGYEDLEAEGRDEDLSSEVWAEIVELTPPG